MTNQRNKPSLRTRTVQSGRRSGDEAMWPVVPPIVTSAAYAARDPDLMQERVRRGEPTYHRDHFPTVERLELAIAGLEGAEAGYATSSGMAAISVVALALLGQGDHVIVGMEGYCDTEELLCGELVRFGVAGSVVPLDDLNAVRAAIRPETRLIVAETISNPGMSVPDIPSLADISGENGLLLVVDNTLATPMLCRPLEHGADLVIHSVTKFLGGHHDLSAGMVVGAHTLIDRIARAGYLLGAVPGAHDAALALRGIHTLAPRMAWISESAMRVARYLADCPELTEVRYPGLVAGAEAGRVRDLLPCGFGGLMVVEFACSQRHDAPAATFVRSLNMIPYVPSLGGEITTVCYPPHIMADAGPDHPTAGTRLRVSIGLEDPDDLIADLKRALAALHH